MPHFGRSAERRQAWIAGGEGSAILNLPTAATLDGNFTNKGLPSGVLGKIGVTVSPVNPNRVWAMVEAKDGGLFARTTAGENWQLRQNEPRILQRPWYYHRVYADTENPDTVYVLNVRVSQIDRRRAHIHDYRRAALGQSRSLDRTRTIISE